MIHVEIAVSVEDLEATFPSCTVYLGKEWRVIDIMKVPIMTPSLGRSREDATNAMAVALEIIVKTSIQRELPSCWQVYRRGPHIFARLLRSKICSWLSGVPGGYETGLEVSITIETSVDVCLNSHRPTQQMKSVPGQTCSCPFTGKVPFRCFSFPATSVAPRRCRKA